jgi:hypothetical protein
VDHRIEHFLAALHEALAEGAEGVGGWWGCKMDEALAERERGTRAGKRLTPEIWSGGT